MLSKIIILTATSLAVIYPLCFWISFKEPLKSNFHRFHLGLPCVVGGIILMTAFSMAMPSIIKSVLGYWIILLFVVTFYFWNKEYPNVYIVTIPCLMGIFSFLKLQAFLIGTHGFLGLISILGGLILCSTLFAMNLGHWYLNVHGLPIQHLKNTTYVLAFFLFVRLIWNILYLSLGQVEYFGEMMPAWQFIMKTDGFLLWMAIMFGLLLPCFAVWFVHQILKLKNTQAATGVLYVILCSVLIGDLTYKYYLVKFGIGL
jgi:hypothetical protein